MSVAPHTTSASHSLLGMGTPDSSESLGPRPKSHLTYRKGSLVIPVTLSGIFQHPDVVKIGAKFHSSRKPRIQCKWAFFIFRGWLWWSLVGKACLQLILVSTGLIMSLPCFKTLGGSPLPSKYSTFIYSLRKYLLTTYCASGTVLGVRWWTSHSPACKELTI